MHRILAMFVSAIVALPAFAQQPLVEKLEVAVTNVDVTVTDHGKPVPGLTPADFEIFEDGILQPITNFYAIDKPDAAAATDDRFRRKILVIVDSTSVSRFDRAKALSRLEQFINERFMGGDYEWSIVSLDPYVRMVLLPTSDKNAIHDAIVDLRESASESRFSGATLAQQLNASEDVSDAVVEATRAFAGVAGKKIILLMTAQLLPRDRLFAPRIGFDLVSEYDKEIVLMRDRIIREANASNVSLYIVNPAGIGHGDPSMYWIARETGGRLMPGNDIGDSLKRFDTNSANFYSLGYRPAHGADGRYHHIKVQVKGHAYGLQYRDGYTSVPDDVQVQRALESPFGTSILPPSRTTLPVSLTIGKPRQVEKGSIVEMTVAVPANRLQMIPAAGGSDGRINIYLSVFDSAGHQVRFTRFDRDAHVPKIAEETATIIHRMEQYFVAGRHYRVVVAVHDAITGEFGVAEQTVQF